MPISELRTALENGWNHADIPKLANLFNESAVLILPTGRLVTGRQSIKEFLQQHVGNLHASFNSVGFNTSTDLQVEFGTFSESKASSADTHSDDGETEGKYLMVVKRSGPEWKIQEIAFVTPSEKF